MTTPADLEFPAGLLPSWGFTAATSIARAGQGTNNQTFVLRQGTSGSCCGSART